MKLRLAAAVLSVVAAVLVAAVPAAADEPPAVPVPNVTGPIAVTNDSYPFLATDQNLAKYGYVEQEYFITGNAFTYDTSGPAEQTATRRESGGPNSDGTYPFKTRIVVRRPANPAKANGTVVAEWDNVTAFRDIEWNWLGDPEYMMKHGYTFVGVSAQDVGIVGLKAFNADRYGDLSVTGNGALPDPPNITDKDALSYDIYAAAINAIRGNGTGVNPLGGIDPDTVIASGESQSCGRLSGQYNMIEPLQDIVDAYLLTVCASPLRTDRSEKAIRVVTETENQTPKPEATYPDTTSIRHWEVAGGSHLPRLAWDNAAALLNRDFLPITVGCQKFPLSLVQWPFTVNRAIKGLVDWVDGGTAPPIAPRGEYVANPDYPSVPGSPPTILDRNQYGIAQGGIRYPEMTVPTGVNDGINSPGTGGNPLFSSFCFLLGSNTLFERPQLDALYTDFADYVSKYGHAVDQFLKTGFILPEDAVRLKAMSRKFPELRPTGPMVVGRKRVTRRVALTWVGTEAPATKFQLQRKNSSKSGGFKNAKVKIRGTTVKLNHEPQGTHRYRVRSSTIIPENNIAPAKTTTTPYSASSVKVKVDRSGPKKPRLVIKGKRVGKNTYKGKVRVKVVGKPDGKLPDGSAGVGLNRKSVPRVRTIRKKGRTVVKAQTRDKLGNRSKAARAVIRIK